MSKNGFQKLVENDLLEVFLNLEYFIITTVIVYKRNSK